MSLGAMHMRIGRVVIDAPLGEGVTVASLTDAIRSELALHVLPPSSAGASEVTPHAGRATPLAGTIAAGIAAKIGTMNAGISIKTGRDGDGRR